MERQLFILKLKTVETLQGNRVAFKGFSLIELMIVIAIVGILASIAVPSYMTYVKKARIIEVIQLLDSAMPRMVQSIATTGACPQSISLAGVTVPNGSVPTVPPQKPASVEYLWYNSCPGTTTPRCVCQIAAHVTDDLGGGGISLVLIPRPDGSAKKMCGIWHPGEAGTTIRYLPPNCSPHIEINTESN